MSILYADKKEYTLKTDTGSHNTAARLPNIGRLEQSV